MTTDPLAWLTSLEGVPSAYAAVRDGIDALLRDRGLRRTSPETTAESLLRGAHASAVLEGSTSTLDDVRAGTGDEVARDAVRLVVRAARARPLALTLAVAGAGPHPCPRGSRLGRRRTSSAGRATPRRRPPPRPLRPAPRATAAPALLVAAVVHADIASAAPFASHNGLVARAAERLVMVARGVDEKSLVVPEAGHLALRAQYESNLVGYRDGGRRGVHAWVLTPPRPTPPAQTPARCAPPAEVLATDPAALLSSRMRILLGAVTALMLTMVPLAASAVDEPTIDSPSKNDLSWKRVDVDTDQGLRGLAAVSDKVAWVAGSGGACGAPPTAARAGRTSRRPGSP